MCRAFCNKEVSILHFYTFFYFSVCYKHSEMNILLNFPLAECLSVLIIPTILKDEAGTKLDLWLFRYATNLFFTRWHPSTPMNQCFVWQKGLIFIEEYKMMEELFFMLNASTASLCSASYLLCTFKVKVSQHTSTSTILHSIFVS